MSTLSYRPDIDGLRAVAVLSVVLFHFDANYLSGGFLGVDIFFVISGFLITKIILREINESKFSFASFYVRRAKRILPPLFFVLLLSVGAAFVILLPYDFYKFGISLASVLTFASNMQYALRTGDYFSGDSSEWPLLHTWSLAVEEQYYFILPFMIFAIFRFIKQKLLWSFALVAALSFVLAESLSRSADYSSISYYLIFTRMGELLVGSILATLQLNYRLKTFSSEVLSIVSFIVIFVLLFFVNKHIPFPGFVALVLCVPVAIIINSENTLVNNALAVKPLVYVGLISYSLYLAHWPVLAFSRYIFTTSEGSYSFSFALQIILLFIMVFVALVSYYFIEKPLRSLKTKPLKVFLFYFVLPSLCLLGIALLIISTKGLPSRVSDSNIEAQFQYSHINKKECPSLINLGCQGGDPQATETIILYGNSHAEHYFALASNLAKEYKFKLRMYAAGGCSIASPSYKCRSVNESFEANKHLSDTILIAYRFDGLIRKPIAQNELASLIKRLTQAKKKVFVLAQPPLLFANPAKISNCKRLGFDCGENITISSSYPAYNELVKKIVDANGGIFVDPFQFLPDPMKTHDGSRFYYSDFDHLSVYGSRWLYDETHEQIGKIIFSDIQSTAE